MGETAKTLAKMRKERGMAVGLLNVAMGAEGDDLFMACKTIGALYLEQEKTLIEARAYILLLEDRLVHHEPDAFGDEGAEGAVSPPADGALPCE
jgi:hypothetical protein